MIIDLLIILLIISAAFRGREIGFVQQLLSTLGFFGGLLLGARLQPHSVTLVQGQLNRSIVTLATTLGLAFILLAIGEIIGLKLKRYLITGRFNKLDNGFGSILSVASLVLALWLSAAVIKTLPLVGVQQQVNNSKIISALDRQLPSAPKLVSSLGHLIDPNGFPQVFTAAEPNPPAKINLPSSSQLAAAVTKDRQSVVKIEGRGCGGIVDGSGFVVGGDLVVTNAHVVAGIPREYVVDSSGSHSASTIWFDSKLDIAILQVANLAGPTLPLSGDIVKNGTATAVIGYPGGGGFTANPASILDQFNATGRDIYDQGTTNRSVYEIASDVEPGNSGGPLVTADGTVVGVVFARSTSYNNVGYALTMEKVIDAISKASARGSVVGSGSCAE